MKVSKEEMYNDLEVENKKRIELKSNPNYPHKLIMKQSEYLNDLCELANIEKQPPVLQKLYERVKKNRNREDIFEIINDEEFIELN